MHIVKLPSIVGVNGRTYHVEWGVNAHMDGWEAVVPNAGPVGLSDEISNYSGLSPREAWGFDHPVDGVGKVYLCRNGDVLLSIHA